MDQRIILVLLCAGCFPYRETYRPNIDGQVVDEQGAPAANVNIQSCSATHWNPECRYRANTTSDAAGRFHFSQMKEWDWCCLGEAPLPYTVVVACSGGKLASARVDYKSGAEPMKLVLSQTMQAQDGEWAQSACR